MSDRRDAISSEEEIEIISGVSQGKAGSDKSGGSNPDCRVEEGTDQASGSVSENPQGESGSTKDPGSPNGTSTDPETASDSSSSQSIHFWGHQLESDLDSDSESTVDPDSMYVPYLLRGQRAPDREKDNNPRKRPRRS